MGYDSYECMECYCDGGHNNPCKYKAICCMTCLDEKSEGGQRMPRVTSCFRKWEYGISNCQYCGKKDRFTYNIPVCKFHKPDEVTCAFENCCVIQPPYDEYYMPGSVCKGCDKWYCDEHSKEEDCWDCEEWYCNGCGGVKRTDYYSRPLCEKCT